MLFILRHATIEDAFSIIYLSTATLQIKTAVLTYSHIKMLKPPLPLGLLPFPPTSPHQKNF